VKPETKDRRAKRTRQTLRETLLALLKEKRYGEISVQDIIERADVARSTFYVHYVDKDDLLVGGQGVFASNLDQHSGAMQHVKIEDISIFPAYMWFTHIKLQSHIMKILEKDSAIDLAMKTLQGLFQRDIQAWMQWQARDIGKTSMPETLIVDYMSNSLMVLLRWWVKQGMTQTPQEMDDMFQQLVMPGVKESIS